MMLDKKYTYTGKIVVKFNNSFMFYQKDFKKIGIFYEIIQKKEGGSEKLLIDIQNSRSKSLESSMTLKKRDCYTKVEKILELSIGGRMLSMVMSRKEDDHVDNTFPVFGKYHLTAACGMLAEVEFFQEGVTLFSVVGNPDTTLLRAYQWACGVWPTISGYEHPIMYVGAVVVSEVTVSLKEAPKVNVGERCQVTPVTEDDVAVMVPWSSSVSSMAAFLSEILKLKCGMIRLCGPDKQVLNEGDSLDKDNFRSQGGHLTLFYDVVGAQVRCKSSEGEEIFVTVLGDPTAEKVKERLSFKIKVEKSRLMVYQRLNKVKSVIRGSNEVSKEEPLGYCVGLSTDGLKDEYKLGNGSYGDVFCSREIETGITIAVKMFKLMNDVIACSILREYRVMCKVPPHVNIIGYRGIYVDNDQISIGMELAPGGSLKAHIDKLKELKVKKKDPPLEEPVVWSLATDILRGLNHLHSSGISHRDLKPDNVLLDANKVAKLCDFGLSKILTDLTKTITNGFRDWTQTQCQGTYRYVAPEVIKGTKYSFKADVWSFGATMVHMTTGRKPYDDCEFEGFVLEKIAYSESIEWTLPTDFSEHMKDFIDLCLMPKGEDRPTATELLQRIHST